MEKYIKKIKEHIKKYTGIYVLSASLIIILLVILLIYKNHFNGEISSDHSRWSQFGDFINGVISPIFTAINIGIFWYLTKVVDDNNKKRQKEIQDNEDRRRQQDAEHQKAMILMQFRKAEIDRLEEAIPNELFLPQGLTAEEYSDSLLVASAYIMSFIESKLELFDLDKKHSISKQIIILGKSINDYRNLVEGQIKHEEIEEHVRKVLFTKFSILSDLQKITLGETIS